jgi:aryl-alcohol dehydrogenase-like predicted oxidoreductase
MPLPAVALSTHRRSVVRQKSAPEAPGSDACSSPTGYGRRENISATKAMGRRAPDSRGCAPGGIRSISCNATASPMRRRHPAMKAWKKEGLIRRVGVSVMSPRLRINSRPRATRRCRFHPDELLDLRDAERRLLPLAADKGVGVLIKLPLEKARLMKMVEDQPLPGFAREFGATSWAQFFLKWVVAHPAVSSVLCGTSNPDDMSDNVQAMTGSLRR